MTISPSSIKVVISEETGVPSDSITLEQTNTGQYNQTWFVSAPDLESDHVIRVAPPPEQTRVLFYEARMMRQEPAVHVRIRKATSCPVPEILAYGWDDRRLGGRDFLLMDRLPGKPISSSDESTMTQLGTKLREVHQCIHAEPGRYGYLGEHHPM